MPRVAIFLDQAGAVSRVLADSPEPVRVFVAREDGKRLRSEEVRAIRGNAARTEINCAEVLATGEAVRTEPPACQRRP